MSEIKKSRGRQAGPGIPLRRQTAKQRAVFLLIEALGNYGYPESKYIANKFYNDTLTHMNMPLLAGVLEFVREYKIIEELGRYKGEDVDLSKIKSITPKNIIKVISRVINITEERSERSERSDQKIEIDFLRYLYYAIGVLRSNELTVDNSEEIEQLLIGANI
jgi:hypothetical protein